MPSASEFIDDFCKEADDKTEATMRPINRIKKSLYPYRYNLTLEQIDLLKNALDEIVKNSYHSKPVFVDAMNVVVFIMSCGKINSQQ